MVAYRRAFVNDKGKSTIFFHVAAKTLGVGLASPNILHGCCVIGVHVTCT